MKRKTQQFEQRTLHLKIENNRNNVLFLFLEKNKKKDTYRLGIYKILVEVCVLFGWSPLENLTKY